MKKTYYVLSALALGLVGSLALVQPAAAGNMSWGHNNNCSNWFYNCKNQDDHNKHKKDWDHKKMWDGHNYKPWQWNWQWKPNVSVDVSQTQRVNHAKDANLSQHVEVSSSGTNVEAHQSIEGDYIGSAYQHQEVSIDSRYR